MKRYFKPYEVAVLPLLIDQFQWEASRRSDEAQACPEWASKVDTEEEHPDSLEARGLY